MLLRRSGDQNSEEYDLTGINGAARVGVEHEDIMLMIAEAVVSAEPDAILAMRQRARAEIGERQMLDAIGIACGFNGITKIANATGLPLDQRTSEITIELREATGIDDYAEEHKSSIYDVS